MPPLRIVSYNVRYFGHRSGGLGATETSMRAVASALARLEGGSPDLIAFQEIETFSLRADLGRPRKQRQADTRPQLDRFMDHFHDELVASGQHDSYHAFYFPAHTYRLSKRTNLYTTGLAILAQQDIVALEDNSGDPFDITHRRVERLARWKQTRICGHVRFMHRNGQSLDLFNTHLSLPSFLAKEFWNGGRRLGYGQNQMAEAKALMSFVKSVENRSDATIIVGDFNSLPNSPVYGYLVEEEGLSDAFRRFHEMDPPHSADYPTAGLMNFRLPIDYVFSAGHVQWLDFDETHAFGLQGAHFHGLSDHVPLVARCRLTGEAD